MFLGEKSSYIIYAITVIVLILIVLFINPDILIQNFLKLGIMGVLLLVLLYFLDLIIRTYRWKVLLIAQGEDIPFRSLFLPVSSALAINLFTIARAGEAVRMLSLKRSHNTKYSDSLSSIVIEQVLSIIGLLIVTTGSLFFIGSSFNIGEDSQIVGQLVIILFLISIVSLAFIGVILFNPSFVYRIINFFPDFFREKLKAVVEAFNRGLSDLRSHPILLTQGIITSSLVWIIEGIMLFVIAISVFPTFGMIDFPWVITASCAGNVTFIVPILPGAVGEYETVIAVILFNSPNYPGEYAASVALIDRVVKSVMLGIIGGYATLRLGGMELLRYRASISKNESDL
ncbi:MAG: lysylphosphatidylglycerol synthase transmembrane domain-containing protein [Candidatus Hodarchaeales archaeon]|jgi:uncharacterized protein (TIRG00374 family)